MKNICSKRKFDKRHCWHQTDTYTLPVYIDDNTTLEFKCCWCGKIKEVKYEVGYDWLEEKHGNYVDEDDIE